MSGSSTLLIAAFVAATLALVAVVLGTVWVFWWLFFGVVHWLKTRQPSWWNFVGRPVCWYFRHWRYRNEIVVLRLKWITFGVWPKRYPELRLNMTENGPGSFTAQLTKKTGTNNRNGWFSNTRGPGSLRQKRQQEYVPGDVPARPRLEWVQDGVLDEPPDGKFPKDPIPYQRAQYKGVPIFRARKRETPYGRRYFVGTVESGQYENRQEALDAINVMVEEGSNGETKRWWRRAG